jgi:DNA-binding IclR family transcriptional regulator
MSQALEKGLKVLHCLATGPVLEWRSLPEVSRGAGVSLNEARGALTTLTAQGWVEKDPARGFRLAYPHLTKYALAAQEELRRAGERLGVLR